MAPARKAAGARRRAESGRFIIRNPREIPAGRHVLSLKDGTRFYEGDRFDPPEGADVERLLAGGFIEEA